MNWHIVLQVIGNQRRWTEAAAGESTHWHMELSAKWRNNDGTFTWRVFGVDARWSASSLAAHTDHLSRAVQSVHHLQSQFILSLIPVLISSHSTWLDYNQIYLYSILILFNWINKSVFHQFHFHHLATSLLSDNQLIVNWQSAPTLWTDPITSCVSSRVRIE